MSTFYAAFPEASKAQQLALVLLTEGIQPDDISIVAHEGSTDEAPMVQRADSGATGTSEDVTAFVGRPDEPDRDELISGDPDSNSYIYVEQSEVGAGIATDSPDRNADNYDQMDDIEKTENDMLYAPADRPHSRHEVDDLQLAIETGFPTSVPVIDNFEQQRLPGEEEIAQGLDSIVVPGFGVVMGGGPLATAALDLARDGQGANTEPLESYLTQEGVPPRAAKGLVTKVKDGGAVLEVSLIPGEVDATHVQDLATKLGAVDVGTFDAPRF